MNVMHQTLTFCGVNFKSGPSYRLYTEDTQKNGAVTKVGKTFISHPTQA
jgi:hypothetical protein